MVTLWSKWPFFSVLELPPWLHPANERTEASTITGTRVFFFIIFLLFIKLSATILIILLAFNTRSSDTFHNVFTEEDE